MIDLVGLLPALLPVPYLMVTLLALASRNGRNAWLYIAGIVAGICTLTLSIIVWPATPLQDAWRWFSAGPLDVSWIVLRDPLALTLAALVGGIGALVFLYSGGYFGKGEDLRRYYALLALFASSMVAAVTAGDLIQLLFAWEIIGVTSFLLIGFWHHRDAAVRAARKAFLTIIVGDAALLAGILALAIRYGTTGIPAILEAARPDAITILAGVGILIGAISKSAQFPLHDWLPDAMEGPTPVSAFLHSAAMVKAGLFLVARMLPLLLLVGLGPWIALIALVTMLLASGIALVETDIKRVLAYSTMNHIAIVLLALGLGAGAAALTHLLMHSVTKAMLFFSAGVLIHSAGTQDLSRMRFQWRSLPVVSAIIGALALAGIAPLAAAVSKDVVLEAAIEAGDPALLLAFASALVLGAAYLVRWILLITTPGGERMTAVADRRMTLPLPLLLVGAAAGALALPLLHALGVTTELRLGASALLSMALAVVGGLLAYAATRTIALDWLSRSALASAARARFLMDDLCAAVADGVAGLARVWVAVDDAGVNRTARGIGNAAVLAGSKLRYTVTGRVRAYALAILIGALALILLVRWSP